MALVFLLSFALITTLLLLFTRRNVIKIKHNILQNEILLFQKIYELTFIPAKCAILIHNSCIS